MLVAEEGNRHFRALCLAGDHPCERHEE